MKSRFRCTKMLHKNSSRTSIVVNNMESRSTNKALDVDTSWVYPISPMCSSDPAMTRTSCSSASPSSTLTSTTTLNHASSHMQCVSVVEEQLTAMLEVEQCYRVRHVACLRRGQNSSTPTSQQLPHEEWRRKICEWCYKVVDHFRHDREVVSVAMNYFDRFLVLDTRNRTCDCHCPTCKRSVDSRTFQLAAMTSLYLAIKLHGETSHSDPDYYSSSSDSAHHHALNDHHIQTKKQRRKKLKLASFVDLSRGQFSPQDLERMELLMLSSLSWKMNPTTPMTLCTHLLKCMPHESRVPLYARRNYDLVLHVLNELSRYMTELSVCLANVSSVYLPSQIAYSSILISMEMLTHAALPYEVRDAFFDLVAHASFEAAVSLLPNDETIVYLQEKLRSSFLPEMLMDDNDGVDQQHPISIARDAGLLNDSCLAATLNHFDWEQGTARSHYHHDNVVAMDETPVCVSP